MQLNETFHRPKLLSCIMFSAFWIPLATSAANSGVFATCILQLIYPKRPIDELDNRWLKFLQAVVQGILCLALYFVSRFCMKLNKLLAIFKVGLLITFSIAGFIASQKEVSGLSDFGQKQEGYAGINTLSAMVYVIYSYEGWEYTNYVCYTSGRGVWELLTTRQIAGEIKAPQETLRKAMWLSIGTITVLYLLVTSAYVRIVIPKTEWRSSD